MPIYEPFLVPLLYVPSYTDQCFLLYPSMTILCLVLMPHPIPSPMPSMSLPIPIPLSTPMPSFSLPIACPYALSHSLCHPSPPLLPLMLFPICLYSYTLSYASCALILPLISSHPCPLLCSYATFGPSICYLTCSPCVPSYVPSLCPSLGSVAGGGHR